MRTITVNDHQSVVTSRESGTPMRDVEIITHRGLVAPGDLIDGSVPAEQNDG